MFRIDINAFDGLMRLDWLASCMQKYGVINSDLAKRQIAARYSASPAAATSYSALRTKHLADSKIGQAQLLDGKRKAVTLAAGRDPGAGDTEASVHPGSPTFVQARREMLQRPVLRSVKTPGGEGTDSKLQQHAYDEKSIVINVRAMCDDMYISDWAMTGDSLRRPSHVVSTRPSA